MTSLLPVVTGNHSPSKHRYSGVHTGCFLCNEELLAEQDFLVQPHLLPRCTEKGKKVGLGNTTTIMIIIAISFSSITIKQMFNISSMNDYDDKLFNYFE